MLGFDVNGIQTPCYVVDEGLVRKNLEKLSFVMQKTGCKVLLAQKAFSMYGMYPLIAEYLSGTTASGLFEARLGFEEMGLPFNRETHVFSPAYIDAEFGELLKICDCIVFNSVAQWEKFRERALKTNKKFGIRINPECSTGQTAKYDPCSPASRLGARALARAPWGGAPPLGGAPPHGSSGSLSGLSGLHFHTLCEQNSDDLAKTLAAVEQKFGQYLHSMEWVNFGGGHHITRNDYDVELLIKLINDFKAKYGVDVYLEPGEAVVLNAGYLVCSVLEIVDNQMKTLILDASAACHAPDILEMPYRAPLYSAGLPGEKPHTYRLGGNTCLAGDIFGDYSFDSPVSIGDKLVFMDMAHYSMVKNNTFNGMPLPSIAVARNGAVEVVKRFGYEDFKGRL